MGEFTFYGNINTWDEGLAMFNEFGINWTTWTYKVTPQNGSWGLYHHAGNIGTVNLERDSLEKIQELWGNVGLSVPNAPLIFSVSKYLKVGDVVPDVPKTEIIETTEIIENAQINDNDETKTETETEKISENDKITGIITVIGGVIVIGLIGLFGVLHLSKNLFKKKK